MLVRWITSWYLKQIVSLLNNARVPDHASAPHVCVILSFHNLNIYSTIKKKKTGYSALSRPRHRRTLFTVHCGEQRPATAGVTTHFSSVGTQIPGENHFTSARLRTFFK